MEQDGVNLKSAEEALDKENRKEIRRTQSKNRRSGSPTEVQDERWGRGCEAVLTMFLPHIRSATKTPPLVLLCLIRSSSLPSMNTLWGGNQQVVPKSPLEQTSKSPNPACNLTSSSDNPRLLISKPWIGSPLCGHISACFTFSHCL